jgi:hypothetical protein
MANAVHLEGLRCDGITHGGCQAGCLIFWKEAWLKRAGVDDSPGARDAENGSKNDARPFPCTEEDVRASVTVSAETTGDPSYVCQSTRLRCATQALPVVGPGTGCRVWGKAKHCVEVLEEVPQESK